LWKRAVASNTARPAVAGSAAASSPLLNWFAGMAERNAQRSKLALAGRDALRPVLAQAAQALLAVDTAQFIAPVRSGVLSTRPGDL